MIARLHKHFLGSGLGSILIKAVAGSAGLRILGMGFGFLVGVQLARGLGAEGYGIYGMAMSIIALLMVPTEFGLPQLVVRETAANATRKNWGKVRGVIAWSRKVSVVSWLLVSSVVVLVLAIGAQHVGPDLAIALLIGLAMIPLVALGKVRGAVLRGLSHVVKGQVPEVLLRPGIQSALLLAMAAMAIPLTPALAMGLGVASAGFALIVAALLLRRALPTVARDVKIEVDASSWRSSCVPMAMTEAMRVLQGHLAMLMLGLIATVSSVGIFKVATAVSVVVALPTAILISVVAPSISSLFVSGDRVRLQKLLTWSSIAMTSGALLLSLPFFLSAPFLIKLVFGNDFVDAATPLRIMCAGAVLTATAGTAGTLLNMTGNERQVRRASMEALISLVVILPILIIQFGATGAAIATVVASLIWRIRMVRDCRRLLGLEPGLLMIRSRAK